MTQQGRRSGRSVREIALSSGAVVGVLCILAALLSFCFATRPLIFKSGSMEPTIGTGALALAKNTPAIDLKVGDIVMVKTSDGTNVTHRIVSVTPRSGRVDLILKGDANAAPDAHIYDVTEAERVLFAIPRAGYVASWMAGPMGLFLLGLYSAFLISVLATRDDRRDDGGSPRPDEQPPRVTVGRRSEHSSRRLAQRSSAVLIVMTTAVTATVAGSEPSWAAWQDPTAVSGTTLSAHRVLPPNSVTCSGGGLGSSLTFSWPNKDLRYRYRVQVEKPAGTIVNTVFVANNGVVGSSQTYVLSLGLLGSLLGVSSTFTVRVRSELLVADTWVSTTGPTDTGTFTLGLLTSC
jgi:signal peptidase I